MYVVNGSDKSMSQQSKSSSGGQTSEKSRSSRSSHEQIPKGILISSGAYSSFLLHSECDLLVIHTLTYSFRYSGLCSDHWSIRTLIHGGSGDQRIVRRVDNDRIILNGEQASHVTFRLNFNCGHYGLISSHFLRSVWLSDQYKVTYSSAKFLSVRWSENRTWLKLELSRRYVTLWLTVTTS